MIERRPGTPEGFSQNLTLEQASIEGLTFGQTLRLLRVSRGLKQRELAERMGNYSKDAISRIERGLRLPRDNNFEKLITALGLEPEHPGIKILSQKYEAEVARKRRYSKDSETRGRMLSILDQHLKEHPEEPIIFAKIARELGVTLERIRQLYRSLKDQYELPPALIDQRRKVREENNARKQLQEQERQEKRKNLIEQIKSLRLSGVGNNEIARRLDIEVYKISTIIAILLDRGEVQRLRRRRRSKEEIENFNLKVKELREKGISASEIAKELGVSKSTVDTSLRILIREGSIARRQEYREITQKGRIRIDKVKLEALRTNQGLSQRSLSIQVGLSNVYIQQIERGWIKAVTPETLQKLADILGVTKEELI